MKVEVWVKAGARQTWIHPRDGGSYEVSVKERPTDGKANEAVIEVLARHFKVPKRDISLLQGASSRRKLFAINNPALIKKMKKEIMDRLPERAPR